MQCNLFFLHSLWNECINCCSVMYLQSFSLKICKTQPFCFVSTNFICKSTDFGFIAKTRLCLGHILLLISFLTSSKRTLRLENISKPAENKSSWNFALFVRNLRNLLRKPRKNFAFLELWYFC